MFKLNALVAILFSFLICSCTKNYEEVVPKSPGESTQSPVKQKYQVYTIKKNDHTSQRSLRKFNGNLLEFSAIFDNSAIYNNEKESNKWDLNKLYGFSDCGDKHHDNSARFGWRWENNQLMIFAYTYINKEREVLYIKSVSLNEPHTYKIEVNGPQYIFTVDNKTVQMRRGCDSSPGGYYLYPYFGGDEKAPHDVKILIQEY